FIDELGRLATKHHRLVCWSALFGGIMGPKSHVGLLDRTRILQENGAQVVPQVSGRAFVLDFNFLQPYPFESRDYFKPTMETELAGKRRIYADPEFRATFREDLREGAAHPFAGWYSRSVISRNPADPFQDNKPVVQAAREAG